MARWIQRCATWRLLALLAHRSWPSLVWRMNCEKSSRSYEGEETTNSAVDSRLCKLVACPQSVVGVLP